VPNAYVYISGQGTNGASNRDGTYTFYDGTYTIFFAEGSYGGDAEKYPCYVDSAWQSFTLGAGGISGVDFTIARKCGTIAGRVTDDQGAGVCDADVRIEYPSGSWFDTEYTAWDWHGQAGIGTYRAWVPVGTWNLEASKTGYGGATPPYRTAEITICGAIVTGQDFQLVSIQSIYLPVVMRNH
jgi:hypothetical protein